MKKVLTATLITILCVEFIAFIVAMNANQSMTSFGTITFLLAMFLLLPGVVACIPKASRDVGKGILVACCILIIIGTAVCSNSHFSLE